MYFYIDAGQFGPHNMYTKAKNCGRAHPKVATKLADAKATKAEYAAKVVELTTARSKLTPDMLAQFAEMQREVKEEMNLIAIAVNKRKVDIEFEIEENQLYEGNTDHNITRFEGINDAVRNSN
jgi:hypothetical protein